MAEQYEYLVVELARFEEPAREVALNAAGRRGWELVSVVGGTAYLKRLLVRKSLFVKDEAGRPIPPPPAPPRKRKP